MRSVVTSDTAVTVAVRGMSRRIAISPTMSLRFSRATVATPDGVLIFTSASPEMRMKAS